MTPISRELPFDIICQIILLSADNRRTLRMITLTCKSLNQYATKLLYNTSLSIQCGEQDKDLPGRLLRTIVDSNRLASLIQNITLHFGVEYTPSMLLLPSALEAMDNLVGLDIVHRVAEMNYHSWYLGEEILLNLVSMLRGPRCRFRLTRLTWTSYFFMFSVQPLCEILEMHKGTLENVGVFLKTLMPHISGPNPLQTMKGYVRHKFQLSHQINDGPESNPDLQTLSLTSPLPHLHTFSGCPRALDIFLPILRYDLLKTLNIVTSTGPEPHYPLEARAMPRLLDYIGRTPLKELHVDFMDLAELKFQQLAPYLTSLEILRLHRPEIKLTVNNIMPTFSSIPNLRMLYITRKSIAQANLHLTSNNIVEAAFKVFMVPNIQNFTSRIFTCCPNLYQAQFEIDFITERSVVYYRRWRRFVVRGLPERLRVEKEAQSTSRFYFVKEAGALIA